MVNGTGRRRVQVISRRVVHADPPPAPSSVPRTIHLTPWDLRMLSLDYIQKGVLLPKPEPDRRVQPAELVDHLASAFARALGRFHPFAGRLAADERADDGTVTVSLRCTGEGAEFVHAAAPGVTAADIAGALYIPRDLVASLFPLNGIASADAASSSVDDGEDSDSRRRARAPLLAAQVTELADAVFVAVSLNHAVGDGTTFWHFVNTWSDLSRSGGGAGATTTSAHPLPVLERWFLDTCPVPVPLPFAKLEHAIRGYDRATTLHECFFHFSAESVRKLKAAANAEVRSGEGADDAATVTTISSLQALLAHLWRAVSRARHLDPSQETAYVLLIGCRGRVKGIPPVGYVGNAVVPCKVTSTAGEIQAKGLGWTAGQLNRAVASFDEAALVRESVKCWVRAPRLAYNTDMLSVAAVGTGSSPRFDVYGNDFGWGKPPLTVRSGPGNKLDGKTSVFEGRGGGGAVALEVCLAPATLARLVADAEFMDAVTVP
ncbi:uncharacterized acetyltransferase At3g50280-like [Miscanthus floridulus]|uniref:uncharacterized acetyltransferase At3g50280-like n=1 Tax=Miscanthus floridulus TaxID=154761 RepID=UPI003458CBEE